MSIKVLIVDDHAIVIRGLQYYLHTQPDIELVGEATSGKEAIEKIEELQPDVVLMDLLMPGMTGIEATQQIRTKHPNTKVIVLTSFSDHDHVLPAIQAGANGYLLKDIQPDELVQAIRGVYQGQAQLHPRVTEQLMSHLVEKPVNPSVEEEEHNLDVLTPREKEVLQSVALGKSNKEIAAAFHITEKTVKTHVSNILSKLGLTARTQAAIIAIKHGLTDSNTSI
ncbi:DNA-binding response regulator [Paenibacillus selenitireducens]|uniref:DNA-binding response regulator n=1 Tax=Paenibacillus selenitireducens TaxID=1324314 RepID=A0A1T2XCY7_9BACL|nr:response regulator transcription factor [Paenibacillus selenitireducens]OPA77720.1 DNA-binding response regulator [Paenibacillus selenitireducens]